MSDRDTGRAYGTVAHNPEEFRASEDDLDIFDPGLVLGFFRRLETILDACPIDIYAASSLKHPWPDRLQNAKECYQASFWRSQNRLFDSSIAAPSLSNREVLKKALDKHATAVIIKDYLPFDAYDLSKLDEADVRAVKGLRRTFTDNRAATTASIREFVELYDPERHPPAYVPLQPPYADHFETVSPIVEDSPLDHRYVLGGLKGADPARRIDELLDFREVAGPEPVAHGLGWGLSDELVLALRDEPELLDSVDNSGPAQAIQNGKVLDKHWQANDCAQVDGHYQNSVGGGFEFAMLLAGAHRLTEFNDDFENASQQTGLGDFAGGAPADD